MNCTHCSVHLKLFWFMNFHETLIWRAVFIIFYIRIIFLKPVVCWYAFDLTWTKMGNFYSTYCPLFRNFQTRYFPLIEATTTTTKQSPVKFCVYFIYLSLSFYQQMTLFLRHHILSVRYVRVHFSFIFSIFVNEEMEQ